MKLGMFAAASCLTIASAFSAPVHAQEEGASSGEIEEIVVQARRRSETAQSVPVAITAISGDDLVNRSVVTVKDIQAQTPSLQVMPASNSPTSVFLSIRAQTNADIRLNQDLAVGVYVDGVYLPRAIGLDASDLFDVERVEVLKGPQGTLFGRNTTGGAINIFTKTARQEAEGLARLRVGNFGTLNATGMINLPLSDTLAIRIAAVENTRDGFARNSVGDRRRLGSRDDQSLRGSLLWEPTDALSVTLRGYYGHSASTGPAFKPVDMIAGSTANRVVAAETGLSLPDARALYLSYVGGDKQVAAFNQPFDERVRNYGGSATVEWEVADSVEIKSITAYQGFKRFTRSDLDASPFSIIGYDFYRTKDHQFSQELQIGGTSFDDALTWVGGGYYSDERGWEGGDQRTTPAISANSPATTYGRIRNRNWGVFAQVSYRIVEGLNATAGLRYSKDIRDLFSANHNPTICTALGVPLTGLSGPCGRQLPTATFDGVSYTASLDYSVTRGVMLYARTGRGFRSGGLPLTGGSTASAAAATLSFAPFQPEEVTDYEVGVKADLFDRHARVNLAYYHSDYSNIQRSISQFFPGLGTIAQVQNAATGKIDGVEAEVTITPLSGLELRASGAYTDARFTDYVVNGVDLSATPIVFAPKWSYSLSGAYTADMSFGSVRAQLDYGWNDKLTTSGTRGVRNPLGLLNGRLSASLESAGLDIAVYGRNLTNEHYNAYSIDQSSLGIVVALQGEPRSYGIEITKHF